MRHLHLPPSVDWLFGYKASLSGRRRRTLHRLRVARRKRARLYRPQPLSEESPIQSHRLNHRVSRLAKRSPPIDRTTTQFADENRHALASQRAWSSNSKHSGLVEACSTGLVGQLRAARGTGSTTHRCPPLASHV